VIRLTIFVIALLLAIEAIEATSAWLITLAVLSGIELFRIGPNPRRWRRRIRAWVAPPWSWEEEDW